MSLWQLGPNRLQEDSAMVVELKINNSTDPRARFVSWFPSPCQIRVTNASGAAGPTVNVQITGKSAAGGGAVVFRKGTMGAFANSLTLALPTNRAAVPFLCAGKFGRPSVSNVHLTIPPPPGTPALAPLPLIPPVRKHPTNST